MTLIAYVKKNGISTLISDVLLARKYVPQPGKINLPMRELEQAEIEGNFHIAGMIQKTCIINGSLVVAWAGSQKNCEAYILKLKERFKDSRNISEKDITDFVRTNHGLGSDDQIIGVAVSDIEGRTNFFSFGLNCPAIFDDPDNRRNEIRVGGSGSGLFLEATNSLDSQVAHVDDIRYSLAQVLGYASLMYVYDLVSTINIQKAFGGAYEITSFSLPDNSFKKVGNIFFYYLISDVSDPLSLAIHPLILKQYYVSDFLVVDRLRYTLDLGKDQIVMRNINRDVFIYKGVGMDLSQDVKDQLQTEEDFFGLNPDYVSVTILQKKGDQIVGIMPYVRSSGDLLYTIKPHDNAHQVLSVNPQLFREIQLMLAKQLNLTMPDVSPDNLSSK